jgi:hypothetical protein
MTLSVLTQTENLWLSSLSTVIPATFAGMTNENVTHLLNESVRQRSQSHSPSESLTDE